MGKWSVGVFASIDAGLGVQLEVARDLGIRTVQLHTPAKESRTPENASSFLKKLEEYGITVTCVFLGFEGESYETIAITAQTVGLVPEETKEYISEEVEEEEVWHADIRGQKSFQKKILKKQLTNWAPRLYSCSVGFVGLDGVSVGSLSTSLPLGD